jgi:hypothetical protein
MQYEESEIKKALEVPANLVLLTDMCNKYLRQKDALVDARNDLDTMLVEDIKFPTLTEVVKEDGKDVTVRAEKPGQYLNRLVDALVKGTFSHPKLPVTGTDPKAKEASVYTALQALMDTLGDVTTDGTAIKRDEKTGRLTAPGYAYRLDMARPERVSKPKTPPDYALEGATQIITKGSESKWKEKFAKGFTDANGVVIDPIAHEAFDVKPAKGATVEETEKVKQSNILALAWAITAKEQQVREKTKSKTLAEFN